MQQYLVYWKPRTLERNLEGMDTMRHTASQQYRDIATGDVLWIISSRGPNDLFLFGRQRVDRLVNRKVASLLLKNNDLWEADFHAICDDAEETKLLNISKVATKLKFTGAIQQLPKGFTGRNLQRMRCLTPASAELLDELWTRRDALPNARW